LLHLLVPLIGALLAACQDDQAAVPGPQEMTRDATAEFCGMSLAEHAGPKGQIFLKDSPQPLWLASVRDTFAYVMLLGQTQRIAAIYVNDMGKAKSWEHPEPGTWIEARKAVFVIESARPSGMQDDEAVPFSDPAAAQSFLTRYGGRIVQFGQMPTSYVLPDGGDARRAASSGP
jgi:copper chaperone NosL